MQKPDADGYVHVHWPSRNVPHGGVFHSRVPEPTTDGQQFLKLLLDESKFNIKLRQNRCFGLRSADEPPPPRQTSAPVTLVRPRTSRRRSLSAIRSSGIYDEEPYCPLKRGEDREKMKERLANNMEYGDSPEQKPPPPPRIPKPAPKLPSTKEKWNDLITQIRERAEWLAEMEVLGHADPHRDIVQGQIAERMRALQALGVDSVPSTARSTVSTGSQGSRGTARPGRDSVRASAQADKRSTTSSKSGHPVIKSPVGSKINLTDPKKGLASGSPKKRIEENVAAYGKVMPLRYSPRRRV